MYIIYSMKERMENERAVAVKNGIQNCKESSEESKKELIMVLGQRESYQRWRKLEGAEECGFESELSTGTGGMVFRWWTCCCHFALRSSASRARCSLLSLHRCHDLQLLGDEILRPYSGAKQLNQHHIFNPPGRW